MHCPYCKHEGDKVVDSRSSGESIRRRRECLACGKRFTTYEYVEKAPIIVVKRDGKHEEFLRDKLARSIRLACAKRPIEMARIDAMVDEIENELASAEKSEVSYSQIGTLVMRKLAELDEVAYVRFASVYRRFKDAGEFARELEHFEEETSNG